MTQTAATGIDVSGKIIVLDQLESDLNAGGVPTPGGLTIVGPEQPPPAPGSIPPLLPLPGTLPPACINGSLLFTHDDQGAYIDLPPAANAIVNAYVPRTP